MTSHSGHSNNSDREGSRFQKSKLLNKSLGCWSRPVALLLLFCSSRSSAVSATIVDNSQVSYRNELIFFVLFTHLFIHIISNYSNTKQSEPVALNLLLSEGAVDSEEHGQLSGSSVEKSEAETEAATHPSLLFESSADSEIHDSDMMRKLSSTATAINGTVISDTLHFTSAGSPYHVDGMLDIGFGGTLVIDAGSTVIFETASSGITANSGGQLLITGSADKRVTLKSHEGEGTWAGIVFRSGSVPAVFDDNKNYASGSSMQYVDIIRAGYSTWGSSIGLSFPVGVVPYLAGVHMTDCGGHYYGRALSIDNLQGSAVMRNVKILQSNETQSYRPRYGIYLNGNSDDAGQVILENLAVDIDVRNNALLIRYIKQVSIAQSFFKDRSYIYSVGKAAVQKSVLMDELDLSDCQEVTVKENSIEGGIEIYAVTTSNPSFVIDNSLGGRLYYSGSWNIASNITVSGNVIEGSNGGGIYINNERGYVMVKNNTVKECSTSSSVIELESSSNSDMLAFINNFVIGCDGQYIFKVIGSSSDNLSLFSNNTAFKNTATDSFLFLDEYPWLNFTENIFDNNTAPLSIKLDFSSDYDRPIVPLPLNYWGTFQSDIVGPRKAIADGLSISSQPIVAFVTVLSGPSIER